jgi:spore germination cell wall hydrolase CwlJ-like protein
MARRAMAYISIHRDELSKRLVIGLTALAVIVMADSAGPAQREAADPMGRMIQTAHGDLSLKGLQRVSVSMSPYAQGMAERLTSLGPEWTPKGPEGWPSYNLNRLPTLLQRDLTFDEAREFNSNVPISDTPLSTPKAFLLPVKTGVDRVKAEECLSQAVYYESGFEIGEGQEAVAQVVLNRLRHPAFPKSVCGVVYQGASRASGCQFSFTCDGSLTKPPAPLAWARSQVVARQALNGFVYTPVGTATHYHADYVFPYWAPTLVKLRQIGAHIFYRMTGPSGGASAFNGRYEGGENVLTPEILNGGDTLTPNAPTVKPLDILPAGQQVVTLTVGGETKTYLVGAPTTQGLAGAADAANGIAGTIAAPRRAPTPAEILNINEKLKALEEEQKARPDAKLPPGPTAPPP